MERVRNQERLNAVLSAVLVIGLLGCGGCGRQGETRIIDFSDTVAVAKPQTSAPNQESLRVAVAAMVSPKESFVYYRKLLDYMGNKLNKRVHLVQRKTYGEVNGLLGNGLIDLAFVCSGPYAAADKKKRF